jgi:hypothetical protein
MDRNLNSSLIGTAIHFAEQSPATGIGMAEIWTETDKNDVYFHL